MRLSVSCAGGREKPLWASCLDFFHWPFRDFYQFFIYMDFQFPKSVNWAVNIRGMGRADRAFSPLASRWYIHVEVVRGLRCAMLRVCQGVPVIMFKAVSTIDNRFAFFFYLSLSLPFVFFICDNFALTNKRMSKCFKYRNVPELWISSNASPEGGNVPQVCNYKFTRTSTSSILPPRHRLSRWNRKFARNHV